MRRVLLFSLLTVFGLAWACDGTSPTGPGDTTPQLARVSNPTVVPIHGEGEITLDPAGGFVPGFLAGVPEPVGFFPARFFSDGEASHLGRTHSVIALDACVANVDGSLYGPGWAIHTSASGDELHATWGGTFYPDGALVINWIDIDGGTGRFETAHGSAAGGGATDPATFTGSWWFEGTISRVGAK